MHYVLRSIVELYSLRLRLYSVKYIVQCSRVYNSTEQYSEVQCTSVQYILVSLKQYIAVHCS